MGLRHIIYLVCFFIIIADVSAQTVLFSSNTRIDTSSESDEIEVFLDIYDVQDLYAIKFDIDYDERYISFLEVEEGGFMGSDNTLVFSNSYLSALGFDMLEEYPGSVKNIIFLRQGTIEGISGSGTVAKITFRNDAEGVSDIYFSGIETSDSQGNIMSDLEVYYLTLWSGLDHEIIAGDEVTLYAAFEDSSGTSISSDCYLEVSQAKYPMIFDSGVYHINYVFTDNGKMSWKVICDSRYEATSILEVYECVPGYTRTCGISEDSACTYNIEICEDGYWGECISVMNPDPEICDGIDNDCDGTVDEGCECIPGEEKSCGTDEGECSSGTQVCGQEGIWGSDCSGQILPTEEICDSLDNDCDSYIDEGSVCILDVGDTPAAEGGPSQIPSCVEEWVCDAWGQCISGMQERKCTDTNSCGTYDEMPLIERRCINSLNHCYDNIQNSDEAGIDCGGACNPCKDDVIEFQEDIESRFRIDAGQEYLDQGKILIYYDNLEERKKTGVMFLFEVKDDSGKVVFEDFFGPVSIDEDSTFTKSVNMPIYLLQEDEAYSLSAIMSEKGKTIGIFSDNFEVSDIPIYAFLSRIFFVLVIILFFAAAIGLIFSRYIRGELR